MGERRIGLEGLLGYVCSQLEQHSIDYMLSGSVAMSAYTIPRFTRDIDLVVSLQEKDVDTLSRIFADNFYFHRPSVEEEVRRQGTFNVIDNQTGFKIDFMVRKQIEYRQVEFERRRRDTVFAFRPGLFPSMIWCYPN